MKKQSEYGIIVESHGTVSIYRVDETKRLGDRGREVIVATFSPKQAEEIGLMLIRSTRG